jgi:hypothetical protein
LTGYGIDKIVEGNLCEFDQVRQEFMNIFEEEQISIAWKHKPALASTMDEGWKSGAVWFWGCLTSKKARLSLVEDHLCPRFSPLTSKAREIISQYWHPDSAGVERGKVADYERYKGDLNVLYSKQTED